MTICGYLLLSHISIKPISLYKQSIQQNLFSHFRTQLLHDKQQKIVFSACLYIYILRRLLRRYGAQIFSRLSVLDMRDAVSFTAISFDCVEN